MNAAILPVDSAWSCEKTCSMWNNATLLEFLNKNGDFKHFRSIVETFLKYDSDYLHYKNTVKDIIK